MAEHFMIISMTKTKKRMTVVFSVDLYRLQYNVEYKMC